MSAKFEVKKSDRDFLFNLKAANGEVVLTSQQYKSKDSALKGVDSVRENAKSPEQFDRRVAKDDSPYFVLLAKNNEVIGKSQMYKSESACENGIQAVQSAAADANVDVE